MKSPVMSIGGQRKETLAEKGGRKKDHKFMEVEIRRCFQIDKEVEIKRRERKEKNI